MTHNRRISDKYPAPQRRRLNETSPETENMRSAGWMLIWVVIGSVAVYAGALWLLYFCQTRPL